MQQLLDDLTILLGLDNTQGILILSVFFIAVLLGIYLIKKLI